MKIYSLCLAALALAILCAGCPPNTRPDLQVCAFTVGTPVTTAGGEIEVPVTVSVCNTGVSAADPFKVSLHYSDSGGGPFVVAFSVSGQSSMWYPATTTQLPGGSMVTFTGNAVFGAFESGETVSMYAYADSCSGDEFMPAYCRVLESSEINNQSASTNVALP
jgi:hypothetical protein